MPIPRTLIVLGAVLLAALLPGCAFSWSSNTETHTGVVNKNDLFSYGVEGQKSGTETYAWPNSKAAATLRFAVDGEGSVRVQVTDAAGKGVFDKVMGNRGDAAEEAKTATGKPGTWTIKLTFTDLNGKGTIRLASANP